jgi:hypothetical protein
MSFARADAYPRRFPYIKALTLPPGTMDLALRIPERKVRLIGTKAMLVARDSLAPTLVRRGRAGSCVSSGGPSAR